MVVVNVYALAAKFQDAGWNNLSAAEVVSWLRDNGVTGAELVAYIDALIDSPYGLDDQNIAGCSAAKASKITAALKSKGMLV